VGGEIILRFDFSLDAGSNYREFLPYQPGAGVVRFAGIGRRAYCADPGEYRGAVERSAHYANYEHQVSKLLDGCCDRRAGGSADSMAGLADVQSLKRNERKSERFVIFLREESAK